MATVHIPIYTNSIKAPGILIKYIKQALKYSWFTTKREAKMVHDPKIPARKFIVSIVVKEVECDL